MVTEEYNEKNFALGLSSILHIMFVIKLTDLWDIWGFFLLAAMQQVGQPLLSEVQ